MKTITNKREYSAPLADYGIIPRNLLCESIIDGGLEDLTEEEWTL